MATCIAALPLLYTHYSMPGLILGPALEGSFMEARGTVYSSGPRTLRKVALPDGTRVVMNRGTRIAVLYSDQIRSVQLVRGEATFTVPREASRSFALTVDGRFLGTVGSTFDVRLTPRSAIELTVLEGMVTVPPAPATVPVNPTALREGDVRPPVPILVRASQIITTQAGRESARTVPPLEAQARIAWQGG
jgi:transmembrane sensor